MDAPSAIHHIICGIDHQTIFQDDRDRDNFIEMNWASTGQRPEDARGIGNLR